MAENKKLVQDQYEFASKLALAVYVIAVVAAGFYFIRFWGRGLSSDPEQWGQFGDYLGGVINPIVGVVTVLLIVVNIRMQREELRASLAELKESNDNSKRQRFETSFFSWLSNYSRLVESIRADDSTFGRSALRRWHENLDSMSAWHDWRHRAHEEYAAAGGGRSPEQTFAFILSSPAEEKYRVATEGIFRSAHRAYSELMRKHGEELQPFLTTLEGLLSWIDKSELQPKDKWHYGSIVASQLSWLEKAFVFHRSVHGGNGALGELASRYGLLDQLEEGDEMYLLFALAFSSQPPRLHPNNPAALFWPLRQTAFDATAARSQYLGVPQSHSNSA